MLTFLVMSRHAPEVCALHNETSRKTMIDWMGKARERAAKHGVKMVSGWNVLSEHLTVQVLEAPFFDAKQAFSMEPKNMAISTWNTIEVKVAITLEDTMKMMM
jgi:uncharacterized protein with GYD domain